MLSTIKRLFLVIVLVVGSWGLTSARTVKSINPALKAGIALPSAPDETKLQRSGDERVITLKLEQARRRYLRALGFVDKGDTAQAAKFFEHAMTVLNELANQPDIENNEDFTDLVQSIIEDYETYVQSIDNLDENSSIFIVRDKLFVEVERSFAAQRKPVKIEPLKPATQESNVVRGSQPLTPKRQLTIPMASNEYVDKSIAFMTQDKGRKYYTKWLERSTKWFPMMKRIAKEEGMPEEIIYLSMIESGLNHNAVSWAKAVGLWQFMPATGREYDLRVDATIDERRDPEKATRSAMRFLKSLYNTFGDWHLALAGYNCGAGGVRRAIRESGLSNPDFWQIREFLPRETRSYVPLYIAAATLAMNPEEYGFKKEELNFEPQYAYDSFTVKEQISLSTLAKCANVPLDELKLLNSHLLKSYTPDGEFILKIPAGRQNLMAANFAALSPSEKQPWLTHKVKRGETVTSIASKYGTTAKEIASLNGLSARTKRLRAGKKLRVPNNTEPTEAEKVMFADATETKTEKAEAKAEVKAEKKIAAKEEVKEEVKNEKAGPAGSVVTVANNTSKKATIHVVQKGDNIYSIARRYGIQLAQLREWNNISYDKDAVQIGTRLKIANTDGETTENLAQAEPKQEVKAQPAAEKTPVVKLVKHKVKRGETLAQIADDYGVTVDDIRSTNKINRNGRIAQGQQLNIYTDGSARKIQTVALVAPKTHKVKRGENLGIIAALHGVTEDDLQRWNPRQVKGNKVFAGSVLKVYGEPESKGSSKARSKEVNRMPKQYTVRRGDTLSGIAQKFGVSIAELKSKNRGLKDNNLRSGQKLRIQ